METKTTGLKRFYYASRYSWQGLRAAYRNEPAFRYEIWAVAALFPLSLIVADTLMEWVMLICSCLFVLAMELVNTAIEAVVDRGGTEYNPMAGLAKDLGSAVVSVALLMCALVWIAVLFS
ncbi:diacylglycerol kinase [Parathalassolituus penaei]|uniref:Diacylglycerol kinase n=1 Tax=Parathalassolituus penaei TaxID=2997323 RepID=A0A9X3EKT8_9GAMM|nr:diacylglycerol kinase [Parathalassolituus penaei]MCY0966181.1 diacylglycerol kinase [Parathalassolituus penaei]